MFILHSLLTFFKRSLIALPQKPVSIFILFLLFALTGNAEILPKGFNQVLVATGISSPTVMAFAPDGRLFVAEQTGSLRIIKKGVLLSKPFITLKVNSRGERGLLGIAFDPNFSTNKFIYLYYTDSSGFNNRISRFTASGDVVVPGSEVVVLQLSRLSTAVIHNGGNMVFGKDGKLYVGVGDNKNPANAQNLDTYLGKILRINPDGSVPQGNPFTSGSKERKRIWAYGFRNPYTLSVQPVTGRIFVNDVGQDLWEEVNDCTTGGHNYGWPLAEGRDTNSNFTNPVYTYGHGEGSGRGCAIAGGTFFNPVRTNYPSSYVGKYFFLDYCSRWINVISLKNNTATRADFASAIPRYPVGMTTGPDGNLYFLSRIIGAVYKVTYTNSTAPVINELPESITVSKGNPASFFIKAASTDTVKYQWRKNGVNIAGATNATYKIASVTYADSGRYSVRVSNNAGSVTSNNAILTVIAPNQPPIATIKTPLKGASYVAGNKIYFSGTGVDTEDGTLGASSYKWFVLFYHNTHTHPGPTIPLGVKSGSFSITNNGETSANVFYRLYLVVTDSKGVKDTSFTDILPKKSLITIQTNPGNLRITLDGQPFTAPLTVESVEGMLRTVGVITTQGKYTFRNWSNGGNPVQTVATPVNNTTYTATFSETKTDTMLPTADAFIRSGSYANTNFGNDTILNSKKSLLAGYGRESYIRFDISSFTPEVSSAVLRLYGAVKGTEDSSATVEVYNVPDTTWKEATITWNNKPVADTSILATKLIADTVNKFRGWNITQHIKNLKKAGATFVTLKLVNADRTLSRVQFYSKEAQWRKPKLAVTYAVSFSKPGNKLRNLAKKTDTDLDFSIYPNPAANSLHILFKNYFSASTARIYDMNGKLIKNIAISNGKIQQINIADLKNGVYYVTVRDGNKSSSKKLIVAK